MLRRVCGRRERLGELALTAYAIIRMSAKPPMTAHLIHAPLFAWGCCRRLAEPLEAEGRRAWVLRGRVRPDAEVELRFMLFFCILMAAITEPFHLDVNLIRIPPAISRRSRTHCVSLFSLYSRFRAFRAFGA